MKYTRAIIDAIHNGELENAELVDFPVFNFKIPKSVTGVPAELLNPEQAAKDKKAYKSSLVELCDKFTKNFEKYADKVSKEVAGSGPNADGHRA